MAIGHVLTTRRLAWALALGLLAPAVLGNERASAQGAEAFRFGLDHDSLGAQDAAMGGEADYATVWVGSWTSGPGYGGLDAALARATRHGATPLVQFYYWGNDISRTCLDHGCWTNSGWKSREGWDRLADVLVDRLWANRGGAPAVVVVETEFNKNGVNAYEPLDGYLASVSGRIKAKYPGAVLVLGFGNWDAGNWHTFDRAVAASDMAGLQGMRASTRDTVASYYTVDDHLLSGAKKLQSLFRKPILFTDLALALSLIHI